MRFYDFFTAELPSFENVPQTVNIKNGTAIEMAIKVRGFPMPKQVAWFKDGEPVVRSRKTIMQYIDGASKLVIYDTDLADAGLYECYAENEHGNDKCTIPVKIKRVRNRFSLFFLARINEPYFLVYSATKLQI